MRSSVTTPRLAAAILCATALTFAAPTTALAIPLETPSLESPTETASPDVNEVAVPGGGSASLSADLLANPGSATASANGTGSAASGSGSMPGTGSGAGSSNFGGKVGMLAPRIATMIEQMMYGLGFRPGTQYATCEDVQNAGLGPLLRGAPSYGAHLDPDGDGIACA